MQLQNAQAIELPRFRMRMRVNHLTAKPTRWSNVLLETAEPYGHTGRVGGLQNGMKSIAEVSIDTIEVA